MLESIFNSRPKGLQLYQKQTPTKGFSCEYCEIFKNTYFEEHLQMTASGGNLYFIRIFPKNLF